MFVIILPPVCFSHCFARRLTGDDAYFSRILRIDERTDEGGGDGNAPPVYEDDEGGVSESVIQDLKGAFGTDFQVDPALTLQPPMTATRLTWNVLMPRAFNRRTAQCGV